MTTISIVLSPPFTVSKNIPQPLAESPERNCPDKSSYPARLESFINKHKIEKSRGQETQFVSTVNTWHDSRDLDTKFYPDLFIAKDRIFYNASFRFIADNN